jgi:hypothetical protein
MPRSRVLTPLEPLGDGGTSLSQPVKARHKPVRRSEARKAFMAALIAGGMGKGKVKV